MRIVVLGAGESGAGAAVLAKVKGFDTFVSDMSAIKDKYKELLDKYGIAWEEGHHTEELILNADEVVKSPGIPNDAPLIIKLKEKGTPIISEIEFAGRYTDAKMVCITGSNGKTTTTPELIETRMGSGSYVAFNGGDMSGPDGWTSASLRSGAPTTTELLSIALVGRPLALEGESECERFYEIARRRLFRSTPVSYEVSYLPAIPALREVIERMEGLVDGSISKTMKQAGLQAASGYMDVSADRLGPIAQALEKTPETVFLLSERHNFSDDGTLVEYVRSFLDPSHFTLHVTAGENGGNHGDR